MGAKETTVKLADTKAALAEKYYRLAKVAKSKPKQARFLHHAESYRIQAAQLREKVKP